MRNFTRLVRGAAALVLLVVPLAGQGQINVAPGGAAVTQNFDGMSGSATAALPAGWKADKLGTERALGTYAGAAAATDQAAGANLSNTAPNGIYNFGEGTASAGNGNRAVGGLASGSASKSVNVYSPQLTNSSSASITSFTISYNVEKYRNGSNVNGFRIQLYYSTNGSTWTAAPGADFTTAFSSDANSNGYSSAPGASVAVANKSLAVTVAPGASVYFAWNYSVSSGNATSNAQALAVDDISLSPVGAPPLATEPTQQPSVTVGPVTASTAVLNLSGGNGAKRLVVVRPAANAAAPPADGNTYAASAAYGSGATTGPNNYVVVADGSTTALTVTGLATSTAYNVEAYAYNDNNAAGQENYLAAGPGAANFTTLAPPVQTYVWSGLSPTAPASWADALNWLPVRAVPAATDVLVFDGIVSPAPALTVDFASAQTVAQLVFRNGVAATLSTNADRTLTLTGNAPGDDFVVDATSTLTLTNGSGSASRGLTLSLASGGTAGVSGTLVFEGNVPAGQNGRHSLVSADANSNAVEFRAGSRLRAGTFFDGSAFGNSTAGTGAPFSVVFRHGSTYEQGGGSNPFGLSQPNSFVTFEAGSRYLFNASSSGQPSLSGRTYGTLEYNTNSSAVGNSAGASPLTVLGNLVVTQGTVGLNLTGGVNVAGDVVVNGNASLSYAPAAPATGNSGYTIQGNLLVNDNATFVFGPTNPAAPPLQFNGTAAQLIGGTNAAVSALAFGTNGRLQINNPAGVTLQRPLEVKRELLLTSGLLTTDVANLLTLGTSPSGYAAVSGGSNASFVNGPVARATVGGAAAGLVFPVGKGGAYRPLTLDIAAQSSSTAYVAEQLDTPPPQTLTTGDPSGTDLQRVSFRRAFRLQPLGGPQPSGFSGTVTLSFGPDDYVNNPTSAGLVVAARSSAADSWRNLGRGANGAGTQPGTGPGGPPVSGSLASGALNPFTGFFEFALGATNPNDLTVTQINPLPVELSAFSAARTAAGAVHVRWATASERNSLRFEVQRAAAPSPEQFQTVLQTAAAGTTATPRAYAALDRDAPAGTLYYRLKQVDADGQARFSPVVTVNAGPAETAPLALYPNPAREAVSVSVAAATPFRLLDALGQPVLAGTATPERPAFDVRALPAGTYLLELQTAAGRVVRRLIKE